LARSIVSIAVWARFPRRELIVDVVQQLFALVDVTGADGRRRLREGGERERAGRGREPAQTRSDCDHFARATALTRP
jgi:hypothetical protein